MGVEEQYEYDTRRLSDDILNYQGDWAGGMVGSGSPSLY